MMELSAMGFKSDRIVPMRVIVCGVHRTGTFSMRAALWQLGFYDCYHMQTLFHDAKTDGPQWVRAMEAKYANKGTFTIEDWDRLLGKSQGMCDLPAALFGAELAEIYPEAKVIVLNRDPEAWHNSVINAMHKEMVNSTIMAKLKLLYRLALDPTTRSWVSVMRTMSKVALPFKNHDEEKEKAIAWFKAQYTEFRERIPADRRIEYSVKDGWGPLCRHLGVPVPMITDEATGKEVEALFPHLNDRASFAGIFAMVGSASVKRANQNLFELVGKLTLAGLTAYALYLAFWT